MVSDLQDVYMPQRSGVDRLLDHLAFRVTGQQNGLRPLMSHDHHAGLIRRGILDRLLRQDAIQDNAADVQPVAGAQLLNSARPNLPARGVNRIVVMRKRAPRHKHDRHRNHRRHSRQPTVVIVVQVSNDHRVESANIVPRQGSQRRGAAGSCVDQYVMTLVRDQYRVALSDVEDRDLATR